MALNKTIDLPNGTQATYWVIDEIRFSFSAVTTWAKLNGYLSSSAYLAGKTPLTDRGFSAATPGTFGTLQGASLVTAVYTFIKTQPEFSGATDAA